MFIVSQNGINGEKMQSIEMNVQYKYTNNIKSIDFAFIRVNDKIFAKFKDTKENERVFNDILTKMQEGEKVYFIPKDESIVEEV